jgi:hypothetical protein
LITTAIDVRDGDVVIRTPGSDGFTPLMRKEHQSSLAHVTQAIRIAYSQGREDATKQVQLTLRGALGL